MTDLKMIKVKDSKVIRVNDLEMINGNDGRSRLAPRPGHPRCEPSTAPSLQ